MTRQKAFELLEKYTDTKSLIKHALAVEAGMMGYAKKYNEDLGTWCSLGLLHDVDYEKYPDKHPYKAEEILREENYSKDFIKAVLGHADYTNTSRETLMAKVLYAVDELSSFIVACALVRPSKSFEDLEVKSVKKKLKDKGFAKGVDRDCIKRGAEELGVDMTEHIELLIHSLREREVQLNKEGFSLID